MLPRYVKVRRIVTEANFVLFITELALLTATAINKKPSIELGFWKFYHDYACG